MKLSELEVGEYTYVDEDNTWCIKLGDESYYSSKSQDTIMIMWCILNKQTPELAQQDEELAKRLIPDESSYTKVFPKLYNEEDK